MTLYKQIDRAMKYGFLFIAPTFITLAGFEVAQKKAAFLAVCPGGYLFVRVLSHFIVSGRTHQFLYAFIAASVITALMNSFYIAAAMKSVKQGILVAVLLAFLYAALYALLNRESFALVLSTGLLLIVLAVLMFVTRNLPSSKQQIEHHL